MHKRIKELRESLPLSQGAFGKKMGVSRDVINNIERNRNKNPISEIFIAHLCETFDVNENWLRTGDGEMLNHTDKSSLFTLKKEYNLSQKATDILENFLKLSDKEQDEFIGLAEKVFNTLEKDTDKKIVQLTEVKKKENIKEISPKTIEIPICTPTAAGLGQYADNEIIGYQSVPAKWITYNPEEYRIIKVVGDSMSPKFNDGSYILVRTQDSVDPDTIAVVLIDGENSVIKKVVYGENWVELVSINSKYPPRRFEGKDVLRVRVFGIVERCI